MRALSISFGLWAGLALSTIAAPAAEAKGFRQLQYVVKEGDTIYDLARRFGCTVRDLERANQLGDVLSVGAKLRIPACGKSEAVPEARLDPHAKRAASRAGDSREAKREPATKRDLRAPKVEAKLAAKLAATASSTPAKRAALDQREVGKGERAAGKRGGELRREHGERTASRAVEPPRRAPAQIAGRSKQGLGSVSGSAGSIATSGARSSAGALASALAAPSPGSSAVASPDADAEDALAAALEKPVAAPAREERLAAIDSQTGAITRPRDLAVATDPVTGSIHAPITRPADLADELSAGLSADLAADLPIVEDEPGPASVHKLVIDGTKNGRDATRRPNDASSLLEPEPPAGQSIGLPWRGRLQSAARLGYGEGYVLRRPNRTYGTRTTVAHVERALAELRQKFPRLHTLAIGDLSLPSGGPVSEHRSHQSGRDIDLGLCYHVRPRGYPEHFVVATEATLNAAATWALISALADTADLDGGIAMIFLDFNVQGMIYRWALAEGIDHERLERIFQFPHGRGSGLGLVRHAPNHADHLHARFHCAADETGCR